MPCLLPWLLLGCSCSLALGWPVTSATGAEQGNGILEGSGGGPQRSPHCLPTGGACAPLGGVPGAVCDVSPQWRPLPGQSWLAPVAPQPVAPPARPPTLPACCRPSSLGPDAPVRGSVCSEVQAGNAEPFPVALLNHRSMNEVKLTLRVFPGCGGFTPGCSITEIKTNSLPGPRTAAPRRSF